MSKIYHFLSINFCFVLFSFFRSRVQPEHERCVHAKQLKIFDALLTDNDNVIVITILYISREQLDQFISIKLKMWKWILLSFSWELFLSDVKQILLESAVVDD